MAPLLARVDEGFVYGDRGTIPHLWFFLQERNPILMELTVRSWMRVGKMPATPRRRYCIAEATSSSAAASSLWNVMTIDPEDSMNDAIKLIKEKKIR